MPTVRAAATPASTLDELVKIGTALTKVPASFNVHKTIKRFMDNRLAAIESGEGIDWATGEALAFGTLLDRGPSGAPLRPGCPSAAPSPSATRCSTTRRPTRPTRRSTTSVPTRQRYEVINSMLSEEAVLGFEYGYSLAEPDDADPVGSAVRRFRQRRAGGDRPVHLLGRAQVVPHVGPRDAAAAWL